MRTRITIDPNIRVRGNGTFAGFEDVQGVPVVGGEVEVWEPESRVVGSGRVTAIDHDRGLVYLAVEWSSLRQEPEVATLGAVAGRVTIGTVRVRMATGEVVEVMETETRGDEPGVMPELADV